MKKADVKVLLVDDELNLADAMQRILTLEGYQVKTAASGHKALELCRGVAWPCCCVSGRALGRDCAYSHPAEAPDAPVITCESYWASWC